MIKAVFFDIDGTLVNKQLNVLDSTKNAIKQLKEKGILCGVATGRAPLQLSKQIEQLDLDLFITYTGQYVYTKKRIIRAISFSKSELKEIIRCAEKNKHQLMFGTDSRFLGSPLVQFGSQHWINRIASIVPKKCQHHLLKFTRKLFALLSKNKQYITIIKQKEPIYQCVMLAAKSEDKYVKKQLPTFVLTRSNPYTLDILPSKGSKLEGIKAICKEYNLSLDNIMVFGDSWNDREMLESVGVSIAMGNSESEIQALADFVTKTNGEDGIFYALKKYGLIN